MRGWLLGAPDASFASHLSTHGPLPALASVEELANMLDDAGASGRGGAAFPSARKLRSLGAGRAVIIANGSEGEPLSTKDAVLLERSPHLVLDALTLLAALTGATTVAVRAPEAGLRRLSQAASERSDVPALVLSPSGGGFVEGQASAVASAVAGRAALPVWRKDRLATAGVDGRPTLVSNVETLAAMALVARGAGASTRLYSISGNVPVPGVYEARPGTSVVELLQRAGVAEPQTVVQGSVLVGGFHGQWIQPERALEPGSAEPGAGVVHFVGRERCPLNVSVEIAHFLAGSSAGQCGPCRFGLPDVAARFEALAAGGWVQEALRGLVDTMAQVAGRGACAHPDGSVRFLESCLAQLAGEIQRHARGECCVRQDRAAAPLSGREGSR